MNTMRKIAVFTILFLICSFTTIPSNSLVENKDDFYIEIEESAMFFQNTFKVSQDCIITKLHIPHKEHSYYSKEVSKADRKAIIDVLDKINFESLRKSYSNDFADDMPEYKFKIKYKNIDREIHIYDVQLRPMLNLVAKINTLLPLEYRIRYDKNYGSRK